MRPKPNRGPSACTWLDSLPPGDAEREIRAAQSRLAVYGSLAPGAPNHHVLGSIKDQSWQAAALRARIIPNAAYGEFPGAVIDPDAPPVPVHLLSSPDLPNHWPRLDDFEGPAYRRTVVPVTLNSDLPVGSPIIITASIYLLVRGQP